MPVAAQTLDQTGNRQQQRIRQGERSGQLTPREAQRPNYRQMRLNRMEMRMRQRNGRQFDAAIAISAASDAGPRQHADLSPQT